MPIIPLQEKCRQESQKYKGSLTYMVSLKPACPIWDPVSTATSPVFFLSQILIHLYPGGWNDYDKLKKNLNKTIFLIICYFVPRKN